MDPTLLSSEEILRARKFVVHEEVFRLPDHTLHRRRTILHPGAVAVLPITAQGEIICLRQFRYPLRESLLEICAGTLEANESPLYCAQRELQEELNLGATEWIELGSFVTMPGFCDEKMIAFAARGLYPLPGHTDEGELISDRPVLSRSALDSAILEGELRDAKSITAIALARLKGILP